MSSLYKQQIIEHYKKPRNSGVIDDADVVILETNASCGDEVKVYFKFRDGILKDLKYEARGCAISVAGASLLSEKVIGMSREEVSDLKAADVLKLLGMSEDSGRVKCGLLFLEALRRGAVN